MVEVQVLPLAGLKAVHTLVQLVNPVCPGIVPWVGSQKPFSNVSLRHPTVPTPVFFIFPGGVCLFGPGFGTSVAFLDKSTKKHWMVVVGEDLERERE